MASVPPQPSAAEAPPGAVEKPSFFTTHTVYPLCITFGVSCLCLGFGLFITMALLLKAQSLLPCDGLTAIGGVFLPIGIFLVFFGAFALKRWAVQSGIVDALTCGQIVCRVCSVFWIGILFVLLALVCTIGAAFYIMSVNVPEIRINHSGINGLSGDVTIVRDSDGIPHITATTIHDALFGHGFATAQDRLAQLEITRLAASGTLSKYAGSSTLKLDKSIRSAGFPKAGDQMCTAISPANAKLWQRYVDGINYYLQVDPNRPPEFMFLGQYLIFHEPAAFTLNDVCRIVRVAQWQLSRNVDVELLRWQLFADEGFTYDQIDDMWPSNDGPSDTIFSDAQMGYNATDDAATAAREAQDRALEKAMYDSVMGIFRNNMTATNRAASSRRRQEEGGAQEPTSATDSSTSSFLELFNSLSMTRAFLHGGGSNAWAIRSPNGLPVVASDPHLDATIPSFWYPVSIVVTNGTGVGTPWVLAGVSVPGLPGVMIGRNNDVAWGITLSQTDLGDLYVMVPDPVKPATHYMWNGVSTPYTTHDETIEVFGKDSVTITVYTSRYGPDISPYWDLSTKHRLCLSSRVIQEDNTTINGFAALATPGVVTNVRQLRDLTFASVRSPGLSIPIGDRFGGVGYAVTGAHPIRARGHTGRFPTLGNGSFDYVGEIPFTSMPGVVDTNTSAAGAVMVANTRVPPYGFPYSTGYDWSPGFRGRKLKAALAAAKPSDLSNVSWTLALQSETQSVMWSQFLGPLMQTSTPFGAKFTSLLDANGKAMLQELQAWDGSVAIGATAPSRMWLFLWRLGKLPGLTALDRISYWGMEPHVYGLHVLTSPTAATNASCAAATKGGDCVTYAAQQWNSVAATPRKTWGTETNVLSMRSMIAHGTVIQCMFDRTAPKGGDPTTLNVAAVSETEMDASQPTIQVPSMRFVQDWSNDASYYFALPGGANGNPFSSYYVNLVGRYSQNAYINVSVFRYNEDAKQVLSP